MVLIKMGEILEEAPMEENKFIEILRKHWSKLFLGFLAVACVLAWGERLFSSNRHNAKQDYFTAHQMLDRFQRGEPLSLEALEDAERIVKVHPELHPACDAMLAYMFCFQKNLPKAITYAESTLSHVKEELAGSYADYSKTSILIAAKQYEPALSQAQELHEKLRNITSCPTLQGMNLIRIIFLADATKQQDLKEKAWAEFKKHPSFDKLAPLFQEGSLGLAEFLQA